MLSVSPAHLLRTIALGFALFAAPGTPARALVINVTYDSTILSRDNAAAIQTAFETVVQHFETAIANPISVNLHVAWGKVNTTVMSPARVGETRVNAVGFYNFATTRAHLIAGGVTAPLPTTDPTGRNLFLIPTAQAKALGMTGITIPAYDAYIGFSSVHAFRQFDTGVSPLVAYDFMGVAAHEIEHALGRVSGLIGTSPVFGYAADMFRYTAPGVNSFVYNTPTGASPPATPAYASVDGGTTVLGVYNDATTGGDRVDWKAPGSTRNAQNATLETGKEYCLSTADRRLMTGLGYAFTDAAASLYIGGEDCAPFGASLAAITDFPLTEMVDAPEPAALGLLALGATSLGMIRWRARRRP
jgi:hypothetical protein